MEEHERLRSEMQALAVRFEDAAEDTPILGLFGDKDYNFGLKRPDRAGATDANPGRAELNLEMDREETLDLVKSLWWSDFATMLKKKETKSKGTHPRTHRDW